MMSRPGMMLGTVEHPVQGEMLKVGDPAPDFRLKANDWTIKSLADYAGKVKIFSVVPRWIRACVPRRRDGSIKKPRHWAKMW